MIADLTIVSGKKDPPPVTSITVKMPNASELEHPLKTVIMTKKSTC